VTAITPAAPLRLGPDAVTPDLLAALRDGAIVAAPDVATLDLLGPGAVTCFQGLLTNDVEQPGDGAFVYGALLTPKGMIVTDGWTARQGARVTFTVPAAGRDGAAAIFRRSVPPRLARWRDRSPECAVLRLAGPQAQRVCERAGIPVSQAVGRTVEAVAHGMACDVALAPPDAPFAVQITATGNDTGPLLARLQSAGARAAGPAALELARVVAGWPALATDVDERTIPQEVRFDEIGGVSYTKGCYTGQETVSRLHFRGHANRHLRGLLFDAEPAEGPSATAGDRDVGRVTAVVWVPAGTHPPATGRWIGLAVLRREVEPGAVVRAAGAEARVVDLPFALPYIEPA
jgi:folate-binding protein YgfZ